MPGTKVIFRKFRKGGDIIALFPQELGTNELETCSSYMHLGQHGAANYSGVISITVPASPMEYKALAAELRSIGYRLSIQDRSTVVDYEARKEKLRKMYRTKKGL